MSQILTRFCPRIKGSIQIKIYMYEKYIGGAIFAHNSFHRNYKRIGRLLIKGMLIQETLTLLLFTSYYFSWMIRMILLSLIFISCTGKSKWPISIQDGHEVEVRTALIGCFYSAYYNTRIKREKSDYSVSLNILLPGKYDCPFVECYTEYNLSKETWHKEQVDSFFNLVKNDTTIYSTANTFHRVISGKDTLLFQESGKTSEVIKRYYEKFQVDSIILNR